MRVTTKLPRLFVARHGDTDWTDARRKTGRTDLPLNERGEERSSPDRRAAASNFHLRKFLQAHCNAPAGHVNWLASARSPSQTPSLVEWDYGSFEGKLTLRNPKGSARLGTVSRRLSWRRIAGGCGRARRSLHLARAQCRRRRVGVFERPHYSHDRGTLAGIAARRRTVLLLPASKHRRSRLRT